MVAFRKDEVDFSKYLRCRPPERAAETLDFCTAAAFYVTEFVAREAAQAKLDRLLLVEYEPDLVTADDHVEAYVRYELQEFRLFAEQIVLGLLLREREEAGQRDADLPFGTPEGAARVGYLTGEPAHVRRVVWTAWRQSHQWPSWAVLRFRLQRRYHLMPDEADAVIRATAKAEHGIGAVRGFGEGRNAYSFVVVEHYMEQAEHDHQAELRLLERHEKARSTLAAAEALAKG